MINAILVEDDLSLAGNIIDYLELEDIVCDHASNGKSALNLIAENHYQVIILDINLPKLNGFSVCEQIRAEGKDTSIIMLTARDQLEDKLTGFAAGSDDYLVKPFAMPELVARIKALALRKSSQVTLLSLGPLKLNLSTKQAHINERPLKLTPTGQIIIEHLLRAHPNPVSRESLLQAVWGDEQPDSNPLKVHIHHLRKTLAEHDASFTVQALPRQGFTLLWEHKHQC
ncbi:response regulator transcription factor [Pseudoalteromonas sp. T1lg65]|uniref:response regulator transcription factor n=1 Tax=Pseudoalteromonas sp. T1lg65 TaxID=2077101 RepID=UPI003F78F493